MESLNSRLHELNKTELQHKVRLGEIPKDRADSRKAIGDLDKQLKNEELGSADTFVMIRIRAEELAMEYHIDSLDSESKLYELENRLLPLNGDLLAREVKILEAEIENWNHAANQRRRQDLEEEARLARAQLVDAPNKSAPQPKKRSRSRNCSIVFTANTKPLKRASSTTNSVKLTDCCWWTFAARLSVPSKAVNVFARSTVNYKKSASNESRLTSNGNRFRIPLNTLQKN